MLSLTVEWFFQFKSFRNMNPFISSYKHLLFQFVILNYKILQHHFCSAFGIQFNKTNCFPKKKIVRQIIDIL